MSSMLVLILLMLLLCAIPTNGSMLWKYNMGEMCGRTISMNDDNVYGLEILMKMTSQIEALGACRLTLQKRSDLDYLHFYIADMDNLVDCVHMSLHINEGDAIDELVPYSGLSRVCGWKTANIAEQHYSTSRRYLVLEVSWDFLAAAAFRGTVFRLVANSYTCDPTCAHHKCDHGPCVHSHLTEQPDYDFCGRSVNCSHGNATSSEDEISRDEGLPSLAVGILIGSFSLVICWWLCCFCCLGPLAECRESSGKCDRCRTCCKSCVCHCAARCIQGGEFCCEGAGLAKERLTECWGDLRSQTSAASVDQPVTAATPTLDPTNLNEIISTDVAVDNEPIDTLDDTLGLHDSSDEEYSERFEFDIADFNDVTIMDDDRSSQHRHSEQFSDGSDNGDYRDAMVMGDDRAPADTHAPPPSYTTAIATPTIPVAPPTDTPVDPPSYDAVIVPPIDELPDYNMVMANRTFYNTRSTNACNVSVDSPLLETDI